MDEYIKTCYDYYYERYDQGFVIGDECKVEVLRGNEGV